MDSEGKVRKSGRFFGKDGGAPNCAKARSGESLRDFLHTLRIVRKELNASYVWLRRLDQAGIGNAERLAALLKECDELRSIISPCNGSAGTHE